MHGIILGGALEREDTSETRNQAQSMKIRGEATRASRGEQWVNIKRSAGAHRIATELRRNGWDIEVLDFWPAWTEEELLQFFESRVRSDTVWVGISSMFPIAGPGDEGHKIMAGLNAKIAAIRKEHPQLKWIGGSQNLTAGLGYHLDYHIAGFAEVGIIELLKYITGKGPEPAGMETRNIWGMDKTIINCRHSHPAFPWPHAGISYEERDFMREDDVPVIEFSRGCKFKCKFCSFSVLGVKGDYSRDEESLYNELMENYVKWGIETYSVSDETINDDDAKLEKLARVAKRLPFKPKFQGFIRADLLAIKEHQWPLLWDAGIHSHLYGIETLNHEAGKFVGKGMDPEKLKVGLLKAQDYFKEKGYFRCTVSNIIGIPGETEDSFYEGREWILNNLKGHSYSFFPLFIGQGLTMQLMTNPSVLETEWAKRDPNNPGKLWETNAEEMGVDYNEISEPLRATAKFYMEAPAVAKWQNKDMNIWQAFKLFNKIATEPLLPSSIAPGIFFYHRYLTGGKYTHEDMQKPFVDQSVIDAKGGIQNLEISDYNIDPNITEAYEIQMGIIEDYKRKKLTWNDK